MTSFQREEGDLNSLLLFRIKYIPYNEKEMVKMLKNLAKQFGILVVVGGLITYYGDLRVQGDKMEEEALAKFDTWMADSEEDTEA